MVKEFEMLEKIQSKVSPCFLLFLLVFGYALMLLSHGILWGEQQFSSSFFVYGMKISLACYVFLIVFLFPWTQRILTVRSAIFFIIFIGSSLTPFLYSSTKSAFYYFADMGGFLVFGGTLLITKQLLVRRVFTIDDYLSFLQIFALAVSCVVIGCYVVFGLKVSIPPELHGSLVSSLLLILFYSTNTYRKVFFVGGTLVVGGVFSLHVVTIFSIFFALALYGIFSWYEKKTNWSALLVLMIIFVVCLGSVKLNSLNSLGRYEVFKPNRSEYMQDVFSKEKKDTEFVKQFLLKKTGVRGIEAYLVLAEMKQAGFGEALFGKGFGATFSNIEGLLPKKASFVHHAHITPIILFLRNGIIGVLLWVVAGVWSFKALFTKNRPQFIFAAGCTMNMIASLTDQYMYWGVLNGIYFGGLLYLQYQKKVGGGDAY